MHKVAERCFVHIYIYIYIRLCPTKPAFDIRICPRAVCGAAGRRSVSGRVGSRMVVLRSLARSFARSVVHWQQLFRQVVVAEMFSSAPGRLPR